MDGTPLRKLLPQGDNVQNVGCHLGYLLMIMSEAAALEGAHLVQAGMYPSYYNLCMH